MMGMFPYAEFFLYGVLLTPVAAYLGKKVTDCLNKRAALKDLKGNMYMKPGQRFKSIQETGTGQIAGPGMVMSVKLGCVEVELDSASVMRFTCQEWKLLHPTWELDK